MRSRRRQGAKRTCFVTNTTMFFNHFSSPASRISIASRIAVVCTLFLFALCTCVACLQSGLSSSQCVRLIADPSDCRSVNTLNRASPRGLGGLTVSSDLS